MLFLFSAFFDYLGSLALLAVLALAYGHLHRGLARQKLGEGLLGLCFGGVAALQMNMPIEPMPGLIIDLRNAPIILCAAFLNWRATVTCVSIAMATRFHIGGIGMWSGLLAMIIAALAGALWGRLTQAVPQRNFAHFLALSALGSSHLFAAFILPEPAFTWFVQNALLPIIEMNLVAVTAVAFLIDAEQSKIGMRERLAAAAVVHPDHGVMTSEAMLRDLSLRVAAGQQAAPVALLRVRLRRLPLVTEFMTPQWQMRRLGLVHQRLASILPEGHAIAAHGTRDLILPLDHEELKNLGQIETDIRRVVRDQTFNFPEGVAMPLAVDTECADWSLETPVDVALAVLDTRPFAQWTQRGSSRATAKDSLVMAARIHSAVAPDAVDTLFAKAGARMALQS